MCDQCRVSGLRSPKVYPPEVQRYRDHLFRLMEKHHVKVHELPDLRPDHASLLQMTYVGATLDTPGPRRALIELAEVTSDALYAVGLHELGHHVAPAGTSAAIGSQSDIHRAVARGDVMLLYDVLRAEQAAWEWAQAHALEWTVGMESVRQIATGTYLEAIRRARVTAGV